MQTQDIHATDRRYTKRDFGKSVIPTDVVRAIVNEHHSEGISALKLAKKYDIHPTYVSGIAKGKVRIQDTIDLLDKFGVEPKPRKRHSPSEKKEKRVQSHQIFNYEDVEKMVHLRYAERKTPKQIAQAMGRGNESYIYQIVSGKVRKKDVEKAKRELGVQDNTLSRTHTKISQSKIHNLDKGDIVVKVSNTGTPLLDTLLLVVSHDGGAEKVRHLVHMLDENKMTDADAKTATLVKKLIE